MKGLVTSRCIIRRRKNERQTLLKNEGHDVYLQTNNGKKLKVCRKFFFNTLALGEDTFKRWVKDTNNLKPNENDSDAEITEETGEITEAETVKELSKTSRKMVRDNVKSWLQQLPKVPSHYCRSSTNKIYVESTFRSKLHIFAAYKEWCVASNLKPTGRILFCTILDEENIAIHAVVLELEL